MAHQALLANAHNQVHVIAALSTLAGFLARLGCHQFQVDTTSFQPNRTRAAQPERSAAMKAGRLPTAKTLKPAEPSKPPATQQPTSRQRKPRTAPNDR